MLLVARTHTGRLRQRNEDTVAVEDGLGAAMVADGMGGLPHGDVASREAVAAAMEYLRRGGGSDGLAVLGQALNAANGRVRQVAPGGGTTGVLASFSAHGRCGIAHVGDSRAYHLHTHGLSLLTRDHSLVQDLVERGALAPEAARHSPQRNVITQALGLTEDLEPQLLEIELAPPDLLLLCSDGLWDMLEDAEIEALLGRCGPGEAGLAACADALIEAANAAGGLDNISVVLARPIGAVSRPRMLSSRE